MNTHLTHPSKHPSGPERVYTPTPEESHTTRDNLCSCCWSGTTNTVGKTFIIIIIVIKGLILQKRHTAAQTLSSMHLMVFCAVGLLSNDTNQSDINISKDETKV